MSWLFSLALVEAFSAATYSAGEPSAPLNLMPTVQPFSRNGKTMDCFLFSRFGLTCEPLMDDRGEALLTWFRADIHASLPVVPPLGAMSRQTYGRICYASSEKSGLDLFSPRTSASPCLPSEPLEQTSSASATEYAGHSQSVPQTAERRISAHDFGCLATPTATANQLCKTMRRHPGSRNLQALADATGLTLQTLYEWLMGWPIGWTALLPLAMDRFREWQQQHGAL